MRVTVVTLYSAFNFVSLIQTTTVNYVCRDHFLHKVPIP
jgi:hypothetical protein